MSGDELWHDVDEFRWHTGRVSKALKSKIGIAIGTYGDKALWTPLVYRAAHSIDRQGQPVDAVWCHRETLQEARNDAIKLLKHTSCEWVIILDADDELDRNYVSSAALAASLPEQLNKDGLTVVQPSVLQVEDGVEARFPFINEPVDFLVRNYLPIGCLHSIALHEKIGGFGDLPMLEDWEYWTRCWIAGARFVQAPDAIYKAHLDSERPGRNINQPAEVEEQVCAYIRSWYRAQAQREGIL